MRSYGKWRYLKFVLPVVLLIVIVLSVLFAKPAAMFSKIDESWEKYSCDVKLIRLNTEIQITNNGETIGTIKGNILRFLTDPLTLYNASGKKVAYADDTYHIIAQDSHVIIVDGVATAEMVGLIKLFGEAYDIYDANGKLIAYADFDLINYSGKIVNSKNEILAIYKSNPLLRDFTVYVSDINFFDKETLLMIFASYYSDQEADSRSSSSSSSSD